MSVFDEIRSESREQLIGHLLCVFVPLDPNAPSKVKEEIEQRRRDYVHCAGLDSKSTDELRQMVYPTAA